MQINICCCARFFGEGLKLLLERELLDKAPTIDVCSDPSVLFQNKPDLLIVDYTALSSLLLETCATNNGTKTLLLGSSCASLMDSRRVATLVSNGLIGIVTSDSDAATLRKSIVAAISGELWLTRKQAWDLLRAKTDAAAPGSIALKPKEKEIVKLLCRGYRNKAIMETLHLSEQAVKSHISRIGRKFGVTDRLQIALCALRRWPDLL